MRVGIEFGGTFTDLVAIGPDGIRMTKVPSVPRTPDEGAFNALAASGIAISSIEDGHDVQWWPDWTWKAGAICMIDSDPKAGLHRASADPRRSTYALGW